MDLNNTDASAADFLERAAKLYREKNAEYKDGYKRVGESYAAMFPKGVVLRTPEDFNRFTLFMLLVHKLNRYAVNFTNRGGHVDSLDDLAVYSMMLKELDTQQ